MKTKILMTLLYVLPTVAGAAMPYRVEQVANPVDNTAQQIDINRFYIGGAYNFSMWQSFTDEHNISIDGKNTSGFEAVVGVHISDAFRIEANYVRTDAKWKQFEISNNMALLNMIVDAHIDPMYSLLRTQMLVPYVGFGAGATWMDADNNISLGNKIAPTVTAMAGISVEFNPIFALDFGYRYVYMFNPDVDKIANLNPSAHQFRAGARISF
ncbi:MAG: porin family protein [Alphaproteobacteria bacterium]|nr:porin family protein [Alphaproteobacteria bacterium]